MWNDCTYWLDANKSCILKHPHDKEATKSCFKIVYKSSIITSVNVNFLKKSKI